MTIIPDRGILILLATGGGLITVLSGSALNAEIAALIAIYIILGQTRGRFKQKWYGVPVLVAGLITAVKVGIYAWFSPDLYNYIVAMFEAVLAGCITLLLIRSLPALRKKGGQGNLKKEEMLGGAVIIIAVLTGLSELKAQGVDIKNVLSRLLVLFAAYSGGSGFAAGMGTIVGMVPSITSVVAPGMVAVHSFSGLMAGMFRGFGRVGICVGFILGNILLSIYLTDYSKLIMTFAETALAVVIFILIPPKRLFAVRSLIKNSMNRINSKNTDDKRIREITAAKVKEYARIFNELSKSFEEVSVDNRTVEENNLQKLLNGVSTKVCKGCSLHRICWEKEFYKTYRNIMDMLGHIEINGRLTEENISPDIIKRCARLKDLAITVNCLFENYKLAQVYQRKIAEGKEIIACQLEGMAAIMQNLANEVKVDVQMREEIEVILRSELVKKGYNILSLSVIGGSNDQLEVNVSCPACGGKAECINGIRPIISRILSQQLTVLNANYCTKKTGEPICEFKLLPARVYSVEMGFTSVAKDCGMVSGDSYSAMDLKDGRVALILSDGMGVGSKAAIESKATISLLEKLLETGFDYYSAVKTVNSILVLGSPEETFATVDLAIIDVMKGSANFIKIGSCPSFIKQGDNVGLIRANNLPIGILNNIEVESVERPLGHDDVLVMVSDGLLSTIDENIDSEAWIMDVLQNVVTTDPQNIADLLINKAVLNSGGIVNDDMTVVAVRLTSTRKNMSVIA
jgi:stage II sporulation protein E